MGDVRLTPQQITEAGLTPTLGAVTSTDTYKIRNDGKLFLHAIKTGAGSCTVTVVTPVTVGAGSLAVADLTVTVVATTGNKMIGPFPTNVYNDNVGDISVTFSEVTGLTAGVFRT